MALVIEFICDLPNGVHARPASLVETLCNTFSSSVEWLNTRTEGRGNAKKRAGDYRHQYLEGGPLPAGRQRRR